VVNVDCLLDLFIDWLWNLVVGARSEMHRIRKDWILQSFVLSFNRRLNCRLPPAIKTAPPDTRTVLWPVENWSVFLRSHYAAAPAIFESANRNLLLTVEAQVQTGRWVMEARKLLKITQIVARKLHMKAQRNNQQRHKCIAIIIIIINLRTLRR